MDDKAFEAKCVMCGDEHVVFADKEPEGEFLYPECFKKVQEYMEASQDIQ